MKKIPYYQFGTDKVKYLVYLKIDENNYFTISVDKDLYKRYR